MFDSSIMADTTVAGSNLFAPNFRFGVGGSNFFYETPEAVVKGENNLVADVGWVSPADGDFHLTSSSPARDNGLMDTLGVWEYFQSRYGTALSRDVYGVTRTSSPDSGAVESP